MPAYCGLWAKTSQCFEIDNNKIILKNIEKEVEFLENGLENLATKYEIFTTEKFKGINIKKKTSVTSMFGIGQDNILSYTFSLGDINSNELVNIFEEIKNKKKIIEDKIEVAINKFQNK